MARIKRNIVLSLILAALRGFCLTPLKSPLAKGVSALCVVMATDEKELSVLADGDAEMLLVDVLRA